MNKEAAFSAKIHSWKSCNKTKAFSKGNNISFLDNKRTLSQEHYKGNILKRKRKKIEKGHKTLEKYTLATQQNLNVKHKVADKKK